MPGRRSRWSARTRPAGVRAAPGRAIPVAKIRTSTLFSEALAGVLQRPVRSALTMLGTILGIGSLVAILGLSATASGQITEDFSVLQASQVTLREDPAPRLPSLPFPEDTSARLAEVEGVVDSGAWWKVGLDEPPRVAAGAGTSSTRAEIFAVSPGALAAAEVTVSSGRLYDAYAEDESAEVVVISAAVAHQLGVVDVSLAPALLVGDDAYTVVGIIEDTERLPQLLTGIVMPTSTALARYGLPGPDAPASVLVRTEVGSAQVVADQAPTVLRPDAPVLLAAQAPATAEQLQSTISSRVDSFVLMLAGVALVIGAVGIVNTTLVAVVERTGEIGLRRALGARPRHIAQQFLAEAAILGGVGGTLGTALALVTIVVVSVGQHWTPLVDPTTIYLAPVAGVLVGVLAGLYPALRASRLAPVDALQH